MFTKSIVPQSLVDTVKSIAEEGDCVTKPEAKSIAKKEVKGHEDNMHGEKSEVKKHEKEMHKEEVKQVDEVSPPGFKGTVKAMKKHKDITNPFALAWYMKKKGYESHKKASGEPKNEEVEIEEEMEQLDELSAKQKAIAKLAEPKHKIDAGDLAKLRAGHKPVKEEQEQIDEMGYSAKAARAGKDIGKPGKMFSKIAASAAKKYGSEERGKKVAGAVLKKLRMKEDEDFEYFLEVFAEEMVEQFAEQNPDIEKFFEEIDTGVRSKDMLSGRKLTSQKDDVGPGSDSKSTKVKYRGGPMTTKEETELEEAKRPESDTVPFVGDESKKTYPVKDKSGAVHTPMSRVKHLARTAMKRVKTEMVGKAPGNNG